MSPFNFTVILLTFFYLSNNVVSNEDNHIVFTLVAPKVIRPNMMFNMSLVTESCSSNGTLSVSVAVVCAEAKFSGEEVKISAGDIRPLQVRIGTLEASHGTCNLTVCTKTTSGKIFEDFAYLYPDFKEVSILIETDKPIYKPSEKVHYRVIVLDRMLRPVTSTVEIFLYDAERNLIKDLNNTKICGGIFSSELQLSDEPNLGSWTIEVGYKEFLKESLSFSVDQYILPKFKVEVKPPHHLINNTSTFKAEVKATYTYGKNVKGKATVTLSPLYGGWGFGWDSDSDSQNETKHTMTTQTPIDGSVFVDLVIPERMRTTENEYDTKSFKVEASVVEEITGLQQNGTATLEMKPHPFKIEMINVPRNYKPGFPLCLTFRVTTLDDVPISDPDPEAFEIHHGFACDEEEGIIKKAIPSDGIVKVSMTTSKNEYINVYGLDVVYKGVKKNFGIPMKLSSPSHSYMQLKLLNETLSLETSKKRSCVFVKVNANKLFESVNWVLIGRGNLRTSGMKRGIKGMECIIEIPVPAQSGPDVVLITFAVLKPSLEVIADSIKFRADAVLDNYLNITLDTDKAEPGQKVKFTLSSKENSVIAVRGVDQSVLLLKEDKNINQARIDRELQNIGTLADQFRQYGGSQAFEVFDEAGVAVITNAKLDRSRYEPYIPWVGRHGRFGSPMMGKMMMMASTSAPMADAEMVADDAGAGGGGGSSIGNSAIRVRENFPETWLWETFNTTAMDFNFEKVVPDTLTSWVITGFSLNVQSGIGVTQDQTILETFRPFFITLNVPYSIVKGEALSLQVLVHNYVKQEIQATVTFQNDKENYEFLDSKDTDNTKAVRMVTIGASEIGSVLFLIKATKFGTLKLDLKATAGLSSGAVGDALSQPFVVKPPGHKETRNNAILLDLRKENEAMHNLTIEFPETRVKDADSIKFSVIADLLGPSISNLANLISMPCGCGEQNMLHFVPDIVILDYLTAMGTLTSEIKKKTIQYLETGYQRQLTYRRYDGSYSAFGQSDPEGSTWLTAFVVRSFITAKKYITIDDNTIDLALQFLSQKQHEATGMFEELGQVHSKEMMGGANHGLALSAYVTLAFIEASETHKQKNVTEPFKFEEVMQKALRFIGTEVSINLDDPYDVNLIAYCLHLAHNENKDKAFEVMKKLAKKEHGAMFWESKKVPPGNHTNDKIIPYIWIHTTPANVEMTSYALLTYLLTMRDDLAESVLIAKWLLGQRNYEGGFLSTQDTVVGLTALAKFAMLTRSSDTKMNVKLIHNKEVETFTINKENSMVLQESILPAPTRKASISASGSGTALVQLSWSYYVEDVCKAPAFSIDVEVKDEEHILKLNICTSYLTGNKSNMAVMEVSLPSGFSFDMALIAKSEKGPNVMRVDPENRNTKLNIYFSSLSGTQICQTFIANRIFQIANTVPAIIVVYDYYDTTQKARAFYTTPKLSVCDICKDCQPKAC